MSTRVFLRLCRTAGLSLGAALFLAAGTAPGSDSVAIRLLESAREDPARGRMCVRGYAFLPPAFLFPEGSGASVRDGDKWFPLQWEPTAWHGDGSARGVHLRALLPRERLVQGGTLEITARRETAPRRGVRWSVDEDRVVVDSGTLQLAWSRRGADLLPVLRLGLRSLRDERPAGAFLRAGGRELREDPEARGVRLESIGPLYARVSVRGSWSLPGQAGLAAYRLDFDVEFGSPVVEASITVFADAVGAGVEGVGFRVPLALRARDVRVVPGLHSLDPGSDVDVVAFDGRRIEARNGRVRVLAGGGGRTGVMVRDARGACAGIASGDMRRREPCAVRMTEDGVAEFAPHVGPWSLEPGAALTARFAFGASQDRVALATALASEPPVLLRRSGPGSTDLGLDPSLDPTERLLAAVDVAVAEVTGAGNHGDYRLGRGYANLEYDPARAFLISYLRDGDERRLRVARDMLTHLVTCDLSAGESGVPAGFPFRHGTRHRSGTADPGHVWAGGLVLCQTLAPEPWIRGGLTDLRSALLGYAGRAYSYEREREFAWMLIALLDVRSALPGSEVDRAAEEVLRTLLARQDPRGFFAIDRDRGAYAPTPWVTAGITVEALHRAHAELGSPEAAAALESAGGFLRRDARDEQGLYPRRVRYAEDIDGGFERVGLASPVDELLIAAGWKRLAELGSGTARAELERVLPRAVNRLARWRLSANEAARALRATAILRGDPTELPTPAGAAPLDER